jgi:hypothetical protein
MPRLFPRSIVASSAAFFRRKSIKRVAASQYPYTILDILPNWILISRSQLDVSVREFLRTGLLNIQKLAGKYSLVSFKVLN